MRQPSRFGFRLLVLVLCVIGVGCSDDVPETTVVDAPVLPQTTAASPVPSPDDDPAPAVSSAAPAAPPATAAPRPTQITLAEVGTYAEPMDVVRRANDERLFVLERAGRVVPINPADGVAGRAIIDLENQVSTNAERGLLSGVFSPDGSKLYLHWSDREGATRLDEWAMDGRTVDPESRRALLQLAQPFPNHNGGQVAIGPDGYLYLALGDGGAADDPLNSGQDTNTLLGAILRIDPNGSEADQAYNIPADNPFAAGGGAPEIFLWGVRNPWRFSFDRQTGDLWVADVGQDQLEEITVLRAADGGGLGTNLGWNLREGSQEFTGAEPENHVGPIYEYGHQDDNCSVTGGFVYRGSAIPNLVGSYIYADYCVGDLMAVTQDGQAVALGLTVPGRQVVTFGEDNDGELYVASLEGQLLALRAV